MSKSIVTAFCEHETFSCLICNIITSIALRCCDECSPEDGLVSISGVDICGDAVSFKYEPENMLLTIKANEQVIERHKQAMKKLLHYPELVSFTGRDAM